MGSPAPAHSVSDNVVSEMSSVMSLQRVIRIKMPCKVGDQADIVRQHAFERLNVCSIAMSTIDGLHPVSGE